MGNDDEIRLQFRNGSGQKISVNELIFPILIELELEFLALGTGSLVNHEGLIITAGHVFSTDIPPGGVLIAVVEIDSVYHKIPIDVITIHDSPDVGLGVLRGFAALTKYFKRYSVTFSTRILQRDERVYSICFPETPVWRDEVMKFVDTHATFSEGTYESLEVRSPTYNGEVHQLKMMMKPGSSGALIFDLNHRVIGICTTSIHKIDDNLEPVTFAATSKTILNTRLPEVVGPNGVLHRDISLMDLGRMNLIDIS
jgi:Trypsin-like peptidase domain